MQQYLKTPLLLSSIVCLLFSSCAISKYKHLNCDKVVLNKEYLLPVLKEKQSVKFKTTIDVLKNHLTGIVIVKETDSITKRIVFVTELGLKMFDFEMKKNTINAVYVFEPLNKPTIIAVLKENFKNMLLLDVYDVNSGKCTNKKNEAVFVQKNMNSKRYFTTTNQNELTIQETFHKHKRNAKITYTFYAGTKNYHTIKAKQYGVVKFYFELINITE